MLSCFIQNTCRTSGQIMDGREQGKELQLDFEKMNGLIPAIVQDWKSGEVLMLGFMNKTAMEKTVESGKLHFFSRTRNKLWMKGEISGHFQEVREVLVDCDQDTLLFKVHQVGGAACHTGYASCFYRRTLEAGQLEFTKESKVFDPQQVYGK